MESRVVVTATALVRGITEWSADRLDDYLVVCGPARQGGATQTGVQLHLDRPSAVALRDLLNEALPVDLPRAVLASDTC